MTFTRFVTKMEGEDNGSFSRFWTQKKTLFSTCCDTKAPIFVSGTCSDTNIGAFHDYRVEMVNRIENRTRQDHSRTDYESFLDIITRRPVASKTNRTSRLICIIP